MIIRIVARIIYKNKPTPKQTKIKNKTKKQNKTKQNKQKTKT